MDVSRLKARIKEDGKSMSKHRYNGMRGMACGSAIADDVKAIYISQYHVSHTHSHPGSTDIS